MKKTKTPAPKRAGNAKRERAEAFANEVLTALDGDLEAQRLALAMIRVLARRLRGRD